MSNKSEYFGDNWCPLTGELPYKESLLHDDERIFDCIEFIESARKIWDSDPQGKYPEWKLNLAQMLWKLFRNLDRPFLITDLYDVIPWSKIYSNSDIDKQITDYEIKAVFLIFIASIAIYYCEQGAQRDATTLIDNIEKELNLIWKNKKAEGRSMQKTEKQDQGINNSQTQGNIFRWCGGTWEITFDGKTIRPKDSKGLRYIHHVIHNENKAFYGLDLINVTSSIQSEENKQVLLRKGTQVESDEIEERLKDSIPPKQLKQSLEVLNQRLESAENQEERESLQEKIDQVTERIEIIQGEGSADNARIAVYNTINRAFMKIKKEIPSLYEHLKSCLKTGTSFKYEPTKAIQWTLE